MDAQLSAAGATPPRSPDPRYVRFSASPPPLATGRRLGDRLRADVTVSVLILRVEEFADINVNAKLRVRVPRRNWRMWLCAPTACYALPPLLMHNTSRGLSMQIHGYVAPFIMTRSLFDRLVAILDDPRVDTTNHRLGGVAAPAGDARPVTSQPVTVVGTRGAVARPPRVPTTTMPRFA